MWFEPGDLSITETNLLANPANPANYEPENTKTAPLISKLAELAAPFDSESIVKSSLMVTCYTPNGNPIQVEAKDAEHAEFLRRMNPGPSK